MVKLGEMQPMPLQVSEYCERLGPTFWAEPANLLSNAGFFLAAWWAYRAARRHHLAADPKVRWLLAWLTAIGTGSSLYHSLATPWARVCDVAPIGIFVLSFLVLWGRFILGWSWRGVAVALVGLGLLSGAAWLVCPAPTFGGSQGYFGVLIFLIALGVDQGRRSPQRPWLRYAAAAFALSLSFRSVDRLWCQSLPLGTHWIWHLLNAFVCAAALLAMLDALSAKTAKSVVTPTGPPRG